MDLHTALLTARDFIKTIGVMPTGPKVLLLLASLLTFLSCYALHQLPDILHEAAPAIRAVREQPAKALPENLADSLKGQGNRRAG